MEYERKHYLIRVLLYAASVALLFFLFFVTPRLFSRAEGPGQSDEGNDSGVPSVCFPFTHADNSDVQIQLWHTGDEYALFLPSGMAGHELSWELNGAESLRIDNTVISDGDRFTLASGQYTIALTAGQETTECKLYVYYSSGVNSLFIQTASGDTKRIHASKENTDTGMMVMLSPEADMMYSGALERIKCRGEASFLETEKKSYAVKLAHKADLLGAGRAKQYTLISNYFDGSYLKNYSAYYMARELQVPYAVACEYTDLYMNGVYAGSYLLTEKVEIGENRIAIRDLEEETIAFNRQVTDPVSGTYPEPGGSLREMKAYPQLREPDDISGGYLLEQEFRERYDLRGSGFITAMNQPVAVIYPAEASYNEVFYIANLYQEMEDAVFAPDGIHPETGKHFSEYADIDSFARHYLIDEITKNMDAASTSQFFFKPEDAVSTKIHAGPSWDYDRSMGIGDITPDHYHMSHPGEIFVGGERDVEDFAEDSLWHGLYLHEDFFSHAVKLYMEHGYRIACFTAEGLMPQVVQRIRDSVTMDGIRWDKIDAYLHHYDREAALELFHLDCLETALFLRERAQYLMVEWSEHYE
ncbi:MAG: CotH kinase family protein [Lachnospiraceae bacterium]|nr:CotH kinase family protein [Lachnospiraceae bacterium]